MPYAPLYFCYDKPYRCWSNPRTTVRQSCDQLCRSHALTCTGANAFYDGYPSTLTLTCAQVLPATSTVCTTGTCVFTELSCACE